MTGDPDLSFVTVPQARATAPGWRAERLPDLLADDLAVVFVGTAAGRKSAERGEYYAAPGNRFWPTLHDVGITPRELAPHEFPRLPDLGIGLTDLSKVGCGMDPDIAADQFDLPAFAAKIRRYRPRAIAFTSKMAASLWLKRRTNRIAYGVQKPLEDFPQMFVLCSPSGAARRYWRLKPWQELADWLRATKTWRF